jgi:hypothetical protein
VSFCIWVPCLTASPLHGSCICSNPLIQKFCSCHVLCMSYRCVTQVALISCMCCVLFRFVVSIMSDVWLAALYRWVKRRWAAFKVRQCLIIIMMY